MNYFSNLNIWNNNLILKYMKAFLLNRKKFWLLVKVKEKLKTIMIIK